LTDRRFSVLDVMILVAATALGFAVIGRCSPEWYNNLLWPYRPIPQATWLHWSAVVFPRWAIYLSPLPAAWTFAALLLRFRSPRPPWRRLLAQPGAVASTAATMLILIGVVQYLSDENQRSWHNFPYESTCYSLTSGVGLAWLIQAVSRCWRAELTWVDRLGRGLGLYWISMVPLIVFATYGQTFCAWQK
jgi:hypothetical protein